ncbi:MAG: GSCFA domain-containing protein [Flavobacteriales bacterium]
MIWHTELHLEKSDFLLDHNSPIGFLGSCFSENMVAAFARYQFQVHANAHGILFHPLAMAKALRDVIENKQYTDHDVMSFNNRFVSLHHHGRFSSSDSVSLLNTINDEIGAAHNFLKKAEVLFITFGTAIGYVFHDTNRVVGNCHKLPQQMFTKNRFDTASLVAEWPATLEELTTWNPNLKVVLTVSPVRHLREGFVENQRSKAALVLLCDALEKQFPGKVSYFPAYEMMVDDLRDYRFYENDLVHPSDIAVNYIREKLFETYLTPETLQKCSEMESWVKLLEHRSIQETEEQKERRIFRANEAIRQILLSK